MSDDSHAIKFPINEPAAGKRKSQIEEYLDYYGGPACSTSRCRPDISTPCRTLRENGVEFLRVPTSYYEQLPARVGEIDEDHRRHPPARDPGRPRRGRLPAAALHAPVEDRPTLFFEIIQREGSRGFGKGNFKALFEAIEREQALRGNLVSHADLSLARFEMPA